MPFLPLAMCRDMSRWEAGARCSAWLRWNIRPLRGKVFGIWNGLTILKSRVPWHLPLRGGWISMNINFRYSKWKHLDDLIWIRLNSKRADPKQRSVPHCSAACRNSRQICQKVCPTLTSLILSASHVRNVKRCTNLRMGKLAGSEQSAQQHSNQTC